MTDEEEFREMVEAEYADPDEAYCWRCNNTGWIVTCIDDLCHSGSPGESCIHGDGDELCPDCKGRNAF